MPPGVRRRSGVGCLSSWVSPLLPKPGHEGRDPVERARRLNEQEGSFKDDLIITGEAEGFVLSVL